MHILKSTGTLVEVNAGSNKLLKLEMSTINRFQKSKHQKQTIQTHYTNMINATVINLGIVKDHQ